LRRAQGLRIYPELPLPIAIELIDKKLHGQAQLLKTHFPNYAAPKESKEPNQACQAKSGEEIRSCEAQGAQLYWTAWHELPVNYPLSDLPRTPDHWRRFWEQDVTSDSIASARGHSSQRDAGISVRNFGSGSTLALASLGLDPGIGMLHCDLRSRDA